MKFNNETIRTAVKEWWTEAANGGFINSQVVKPIKTEKKYGHISKWDVSGVTDMSSLFVYGYGEFNEDIGNWDVSNVTNMSCMFKSNKTFNQDIGSWDVSNVTDMSEMFSWAKSFNHDIGNWDVSNVTTMHSMFGHTELFNQDLGNWDISSVNDMGWMFNSVKSYTRLESDLRVLYYFNDNFDSEVWKDKSKAKAFLKNAMREIEIASNLHRDDIYKHLDKLKILLKDWDQNEHPINYNKIPKFNLNFNIGSWDVSNVTNMGCMFRNTDYFNPDIGNWNVSHVTSTYEMFYYSDFNKDISNWDVSNVTNMQGMFQACPFNHDIGNWDVSNVTDMKEMFHQAHYFNQDISNWDVSNVTDMEDMFNYAGKFNQNLKKWKVSDDTEVSGMFWEAKSFNQETSDWKWFEKTAESSGYINVDAEGRTYSHGEYGEGGEFHAYELMISFGGSWADGDGEYEILEKIHKKLNCDNLIFTCVEKENGEYEYYRIIDLPKIWESEFSNGYSTIKSNFKEDDDVVNFVKNLKTISYNKLNPNNEKEIELSYSDFFTGVRKTYHENGNIKTERTFVDGVEYGPAKGWFESGQLEFEAFKENGLVQGLVKNYYENGNLSIETNYIDQVKDGEEKLYYDTGQLAALNNYQNNRLNGNVESYSEEGVLTNKIKYINGKISFDQNELDKMSFQDLLGKFHNWDLSLNNLNLQLSESIQIAEINWIQDLGPIYKRIIDKPFPYVIFHYPKKGEYDEFLRINLRQENCNPELIINKIINENGGISNFSPAKIDNDEYSYCFKGHLFWLGYLEREEGGERDFIIEINRIKHEWFSADGRAILYGINKDSKKINSIIKGLDSLVYNNGEMASGDGRLCHGYVKDAILSLWQDPLRLIYRIKNIAKNYSDCITLSIDGDEIEGGLFDIDEKVLVKKLNNLDLKINIKTDDFHIIVYKGDNNFEMKITNLKI